MFLELIDKIMGFSCEVLDMGERKGITNYIEFVKKNELSVIKKGPFVLKGHDFMDRPFIIFRCRFVYSSGFKQDVDTFTVLFKVFTRNRDLTLYCTGHDGPFIFETSGGITVEQLKILTILLYDGYVPLTKEIIDKNNILTNHCLFKKINEVPTGVQLVCAG